MCCRCHIDDSPEIREIVKRAEQSPLRMKMIDKLARPLVTSGDIAPSNIVPVIATGKNKSAAVFPMVWGFSMGENRKPIINARVETADEKKMFSNSWKQRRCVLPVTYYYEWEHITFPDGATRTGDKYMFQSKGQIITYLAGLYRIETKGELKYPTFTVLTQEATDAVKEIHSRMPVILSREMVRLWVNPDNDPAPLVKDSMMEVYFEKVI